MNCRTARKTGSQHDGFTLVELVVVVVIIAIIAAIAIPKMSRGSAGAADAALAQDLSTIRSALDMYQTEHGGACPSGASADTFRNQLTQYTDAQGNAQAAKDATHIYGPYLRAFPPLPVGRNRGLAVVAVTAPAGSSSAAGWYYDGATVWANTAADETDVAGTAYNTY
ncbi:MAG TPA: prepilin-type N-terminal cleavage/methylation domain-containing protein [Tepidisphaeraceae bacterium]|jgi:general secretion pathway protein G